jgi:ribonuclease T
MARGSIPASLAVNGIDPHHPLRPAMPEKEALTQLFREIRKAVRDAECTRAILVGHNASFDLGFLNAAAARCDIKRNPFHPFSSFDTATLGGVALGQTVLSRAVTAAGLTGTQPAHIPQFTTPSALPRCSARSATGSGSCTRKRSSARQTLASNDEDRPPAE